MYCHRTVSVLLFAMCVCARACLPAACGNAVEPKIHFKDKTWDFGRAERGQTLTHEFHYENQGSAPLEIGMIRSSCSSCSAAAAGPKAILPGKKGVIKATFQTARLAGVQKKRLIVHSNDSNAPFVQLIIKGTVTVGTAPAMVVTPDLLDLGVIKGGARRKLTLVVANVGAETLRIKSIQPSEACAWINPAKGIALDMDQVMHVELALDPTGLRGVIQEYIHIQSNDPVYPAKVVQITGYAVPASASTQVADCVTIGLDTVRVPVPGSGRSFAEHITIASGMGRPVKVSAAEANPGVARLTQPSVEVLSGGEQKVRLELLGDRVTPERDGYVYITVGIPVLTKAE